MLCNDVHRYDSQINNRMVRIKQHHKFLKFLILALLAALIVANDRNPKPFTTAGLSVGSFSAQLNYSQTHPLSYNYPLTGRKADSKVVLGVTSMSWGGMLREDRLYGWGLSLQPHQQNMEILLYQYNKNNFWKLQLFLLFVKEPSLAYMIEHDSFRIDELKYILVGLEKEKSSRLQKAKKRMLSKESKLQNRVRPFLLLSGVRISGEAELDFRLKNYWQNSTHLMLENHCKGFRQINFTLFVVREQQLLQWGVHLTLQIMNTQTLRAQALEDGLRVNILESYRLRNDPQALVSNTQASFISQENLVVSVGVSEIDCPGGSAWNIAQQRCDMKCIQIYTIKNLRICASAQNRLLSACSGPTDSSCQNNWAIETVTCPSSITNCQSCFQIVGSNNPKCSQCNSGYYATSDGKCQVCPTGCATCTSYTVLGSLLVDCQSCISTFSMKGLLINYCACNSNQYKTSSTPPTCVNCPTGCSGCTSFSVCTGCQSGFTFSGTLCQPCMTVCRTCTSLTTCSTCINNLTLSGTTCICQSPNFFDSVTRSCKSCSYFDVNCQTCMYDPMSPLSVICSVPKAGFFVEADGLTSACGPYCSICNSSTVCTTCLDATFTNNGSCYCTPLFLAGTSPETCDTCSNIISGCSTCTNNANVTLCSDCQGGFYAPAPYNNLSCIACPSICDTCLDGAACATCRSGMHLANGSWCVCIAAGFYVEPVSETCDICSNVILNCQSCTNTYPATCSNCNVGTYAGSGNLSCIPCSLNCYSCDASGCLMCNLGYSLNASNICDCDATCQACLNATNNTCSACNISNSSCQGCAAGYYFSSPNCIPCLSTCQQCTNGVSCSSCAAPFSLDYSLQCVCNSSSGLYLNLNGTSCDSCGAVILNCLSCQAGPPTLCLLCTTGLYYNTTVQQCLNCDYPCTSCNTSPTLCDTCQPTYTRDASGFCYCNNISDFYSTVTQGCVSCSQLISNCNICSSNNTQFAPTLCLACIDPYFANTTLNICQRCPLACTSCTDPSLCSACIGNLIVVSNQCACNLTDDPRLYYSQKVGLCISCLNVLDNCLDCTPSPLNCTICKAGTYFQGNICVNCPSNCATCDSTGCLTCPTGLNLSGTDCVCGNACTSCQVTAPNCLSCTLDSSGVVTSCTSCQPGYQISISGDSCMLCPVGCATCSSGTCATCWPTFSLLGSRCQCDQTLGLFLDVHSDACVVCNQVYYGCDTCSFDGTVTTCTKCQDGMFLNGSICSYCSSSCATCSSENVCVSCPSGFMLNSSSCVCGASCSSCSSSVASCSSCDWTLLGAFGQCTGCFPGSFLNSSNLCQACPVSCVTCDRDQICTSCTVTLEVINGTCACNYNNGLLLDNTTDLCVTCDSYYPNCNTCSYTTSVSFGFNCSSCITGYYWFNNTCTQEVCGDGVISPSEQCDDGNTISDDGCFMCLIEPNYQCIGEPSRCIVVMDFKLSFDSVSMSTTVCNQLTIYLHISPHYESYYTANFTEMYAFHNLSKMVFKNESIYTKNYVSYKFEITDNVEGRNVAFIFMPNRLQISETQNIPIYPIFMTIPASSNSVPIIYQGSQVCQKKQAVTHYVAAVQYTSYGVMAISALPAKIVGLELMGVLQLSYLSLGNIDHLNPLLSSLTQLSGTNGAKLQIDQSEPTKTRRLQTTALTPSRVQSIGYTSNFIRNCNLMLFVVMIVLLASFILYGVTYCCKNCAPSLYAISKRLFKEVLLTLILFNCFNFSYSAGLHFAYADKDDDLYVLGTVAAVLTIIIPLVMMIVLQLTEEEGFGEYKDKLKRGKLERAYFMITIIYRMATGYYIATMNQDDLSTLIVLAISLFFLLYNLVNLPFTKAYHNYRANICHLTQFICLFVALYFRSMMSGASQAEVDKIYLPVYIQLAAIGLSLLVSVIVLIYEVYLWVLSVKQWCRRKDEVVNETEGDLREEKEMGKQKSNKFEISVENME